MGAMSKATRLVAGPDKAMSLIDLGCESGPLLQRWGVVVAKPLSGAKACSTRAQRHRGLHRGEAGVTHRVRRRHEPWVAQGWRDIGVAPLVL